MKRNLILACLISVACYSQAQSVDSPALKAPIDDVIKSNNLELAGEFLTPKFIYRNIGTPEFTEKSIDDVFQKAAHRGGIDYYSVGDNSVGMKFGGKNRICCYISFRLFGEQAAEYESSLLDAGFVLKSTKRTTNLEAEGDLSSQLLNGELRVYRKGSVVCNVMDGSYLAFTYYTTK